MDFAEECGISDTEVQVIEFCGKRYKNKKSFGDE